MSHLMCNLSHHYHSTFFQHSMRSDGRSDGTAVLIWRGCLDVVGTHAVPVLDANEAAYKRATCVFARCRRSCVLLAIVSAHLDPWCDHHSTIVTFLQRCYRAQDCHAMILGGDFNNEDLPAWPGFQHVPGGQPTYRDKQFDWIFFSSNLSGSRGCALTERFIAFSHEVLPTSGEMASDHTAEAVILTYIGEDLIWNGAPGWTNRTCRRCARLVAGEGETLCCTECPIQHTSLCEQRNQCRLGCHRLINAPYRSCCGRCPAGHTLQCNTRQDAHRSPAVV